MKPPIATLLQCAAQFRFAVEQPRKRTSGVEEEEEETAINNPTLGV